jgi:branched-chain amino acid transport system ATP-binding protein
MLEINDLTNSSSASPRSTTCRRASSGTGQRHHRAERRGQTTFFNPEAGTHKPTSGRITSTAATSRACGPITSPSWELRAPSRPRTCSNATVLDNLIVGHRLHEAAVGRLAKRRD